VGNSDAVGALQASPGARDVEAPASTAPPRRRRRWLLPGAAALCLAAAPAVVGAASRPVDLNQIDIERMGIRHGPGRAAAASRLFRLHYSCGLRKLFGRIPSETPDPSDPKAMFAYVASWLPDRAFVHPTEGFYYFFTRVRGRDVWGNIRLAELDHGKITFTLFDPVSRENMESVTIGAGEGLTVTPVSDWEYDVSCLGREIRFALTRPAHAPPDGIRLLPDETWIGCVVDESGVRFGIVFHERQNAFYFILDAEGGTPEELVERGEGVFVGARTGFAYWRARSTDRLVLVGVSMENIKRNNFFDGPGDQVPFGADLRDRLHRAYPNTYLWDGIDEHGVWIGKVPWMRVAISPYMRYQSVGDVVERCRRTAEEFKDAEVGVLCAEMTREWWNSETWKKLMTDRARAEGKLPPQAEPKEER
jgi:hypothetical protein